MIEKEKRMIMDAKNIMIVGVGGQGTLLTSRILGKLATTAGYDVKLSEVHGMAQRGGSVVTFVRYGEQVRSPLWKRGRQMCSSPLRGWRRCDICTF